MSLQFFTDYLKHQLTAKTRHGTHSPFVYKLADEVIYDFSAKSEYKDIEAHRKKLLNDAKVIEVTDLGTGSLLKQNRLKKIRHITKRSLKSSRLAQLVYRIAHSRKPTNIVELGTGLGLTTAYLSKAQPSVQILTMEGCPQTAGIACSAFTELGLKNITVQVGDFNDLLPKALANTTKLGCLLIDGNHTKAATLNYFKWCLPKVGEDTLIIIDDIYWSKEMKEAWKEIKAHPQVALTVDLFWIGLVFFRKGQAKEHFKLKFKYNY